MSTLYLFLGGFATLREIRNGVIELLSL